jgi:hypothetical protein
MVHSGVFVKRVTNVQVLWKAILGQLNNNHLPSKGPNFFVLSDKVDYIHSNAAFIFISIEPNWHISYNFTCDCL